MQKLFEGSPPPKKKEISPQQYNVYNVQHLLKITWHTKKKKSQEVRNMMQLAGKTLKTTVKNMLKDVKENKHTEERIRNYKKEPNET